MMPSADVTSSCKPRNSARRLKKDMAQLRKQLSRLTRAIEKIPSCPHSADCPVKDELDKTKTDE